jgi:Mg2+-importing ATPase
MPAGPARSDGLSQSEAAERLRRYGPNEPAPVARFSAIRQLLLLFANPLVLILLVASAISAFLGEATDAGLIVAIVLLSIAISFWQTYQSQRASERLRASVHATATVRRDGDWREIPVREVVPGDVFRLTAGDLVPADGRLLEVRDLAVQQGMLTGESLPADKHESASTEESESGPGAADRVFLGTSVVSGTGTALALATGRQTMFGDIAQRLGTRAPETEFEHGLRRFSGLILRTTIVLVLFIVVVGLALKRDALETLLFAVALSVGLTPEFLPMIVSVTLTQGALRMAREKVIVKHLPAIQNFGSIDVFCSDKTGTLTTGVMAVDAALDPLGRPSSRPLALAALNSRLQTGIHSPLDLAISQRAPADPTSPFKVDEIPFDFERRRLSVVVAPNETPGRRLLITKGAPESLLPLVTSVELEGQVTAVNSATREQCAGILTKISADGHRVLAIAYRWVDVRTAYGREDERDLTLAGFLSFADPILPDAAAVLANLKQDGVTMKVLTGDNELVAQHVCRTIGLDETQIVTGEALERLDDAALGHIVEQASVFTRVSPAQKNRIIVALQHRGHVVGFMGDGINDAPSLRTADVGISVMSATDVAREAADVILGQSSLTVLHQGILEGRRASGNTMKYLLMGTSSNFGNMFSMAAASVFLPFLPMLPTQILLNNFLYDVAQVTIPTDNVDRAYLARPQRWDLRIIRDFMIYIGPISSIFDFLTFYVLLRVFRADEVTFHTGWFVESLATQTLVLFVIRTMGNPLRSRPSAALTASMLGVVIIGVVLPATPLAGRLGFTVPPPAFLGFVAAATLVYLLLVELSKRILVRRLAR